jgi:hypothetical protein
MITRNFNINNQSIECVKTYKYLGIMLTASGKFQQAQKVLFNKEFSIISEKSFRKSLNMFGLKTSP